MSGDLLERMRANPAGDRRIKPVHLRKLVRYRYIDSCGGH
jgi:hypothetical protein